MQLALRSRFIPERFASPQLQALVRRRLAELGGILLAALAIAMLVALVTYNPRDPSPDTATVAQTSNMAGPIGAAYADLMLQYFGLAGAWPVLAMLAWAWRIASRGGLGSLTLRLVALVFVLPVTAAVLAGLPILLPHSSQAVLPHPGWPGTAGPGGAVGVSLGDAAIEAGRAALGGFGGLLMWLLALALALLLVPLCLGLSAREWRAVGRGARHTVRYPLSRARGSQAAVRNRRSMAQRFTRAPTAAAGTAGYADDEFDHVMPGESPFTAQASRAGGRAAPAGALATQPDAPPTVRSEPAPRGGRDKREPSLRSRRAEPDAPRPRLGSSGWVLPPGTDEEPDDMPALPLRSRTALRASREASRELPTVQLGGPAAPPPDSAPAPQERAPEPTPEGRPASRGSMLSITRLLGGWAEAAAASQVAPATTWGGSPRTGRPLLSSRPVWRASASPSRVTRRTYRLPLRRPPAATTWMSLA